MLAVLSQFGASARFRWMAASTERDILPQILAITIYMDLVISLYLECISMHARRGDTRHRHNEKYGIQKYRYSDELQQHPLSPVPRKGSRCSEAAPGCAKVRVCADRKFRRSERSIRLILSRAAPLAAGDPLRLPRCSWALRVPP